MDVRTGFRWATSGVSGVVLETMVQGGQRFTTEPAVKRFFAAVAAARARKGGGSKPPSGAQQKFLSVEVEAELDRLGI